MVQLYKITHDSMKRCFLPKRRFLFTRFLAALLMAGQLAWGLPPVAAQPDSSPRMLRPMTEGKVQAGLEDALQSKDDQQPIRSDRIAPAAGLEGNLNRREFLQRVGAAGGAAALSPALSQEPDPERVRTQLRSQVARGPGLYLWELDLVPPGEAYNYLPSLLDYVKRHQIRKVYFKFLPDPTFPLDRVGGMKGFTERLNIWQPLLAELKKNGVQIWLTYSASWWQDADPEYESLEPSEREGIKRLAIDPDRILRDPQYAASYDLQYAVPVHTRFNLKMIQSIVNDADFREAFDGIYVHLEPYWTDGWTEKITLEDLDRYLNLYLKFLEEAHRATTKATVPLMVNSWQGALRKVPAGIFEAERHETILWEGHPLLEAVQARADIVNVWLQGVSPKLTLGALHQLLSEQNAGLPLELTLEIMDDPRAERTGEFSPAHFWDVARAISQQWRGAPFSVTIRGLQPGSTAAPSFQAAEPRSMGTFLHALQIQLTEQQRKELLNAYQVSRGEIEHAQPGPDGTYTQGFMELISTPEGMRHRMTGALKAYPGIGSNSIHLRAPWGPTELFLGLEPGRGKVQFDGAMGTVEELAVAFRGLPEPLKSELYQLMDTEEPARHLVAFIEGQWERIAGTVSDARMQAGQIRPVRRKARPLHFLPKGNFFVDVGTAEYGVAAAKSSRPMLETLGLSQCVACCVWDPDRKVGGLAHFWWLRDPQYGMERFLAKFQQKGGRLGPRTQIHLIGGKTGESEWLVLRLRSLLQGRGTIVEEDILGDIQRHILFDARIGRIYDIYIPPKELEKRQASILYPAALRYAAGLEGLSSQRAQDVGSILRRLTRDGVSNEERGWVMLFSRGALDGGDGVPGLASLLLQLKENVLQADWQEIQSRIILHAEDEKEAETFRKAGYTQVARWPSEIGAFLAGHHPENLTFYTVGTEDIFLRGELPVGTMTVPLTPENFLDELALLFEILGYVPPSRQELEQLTKALEQSA